MRAERPAPPHRWRHLLGLAALLLSVLPRPSHAHDLYASWAEARVHSDRLEIALTLARSSALALLIDGSPLPPITPENFADYAPRLRAIASELFEVSAGGQPLRLDSASSKISGDADVVFTLVYLRPATGPLRFFAWYLGALIDGHVATLVVSDAAGRDLGWSPLSLDQPVFSVPLTPPPRIAAPHR